MLTCLPYGQSPPYYALLTSHSSPTHFSMFYPPTSLFPWYPRCPTQCLPLPARRPSRGNLDSSSGCLGGSVRCNPPFDLVPIRTLLYPQHAPCGVASNGRLVSTTSHDEIVT